MKEKSQSKKIRDLLYRIWEQTQTRLDEETYYKMRTDQIIKDLQKELSELTEPPLPEPEQ
jgi:hypothetical protein